MEKLLNEFVVNRPIGETWTVLTDVERIAPCMPGAELHEIEGDIFRGAVKVKLGSIAAAFKGQAHFVERDDANHKAVLKADGRDTTGKGNAAANITAELQEVDPEHTKVMVEADLHISGRVAQFGRGIVGDVSKKLINQFAHNLNTMLDEGGAADNGGADARQPAEPAVDTPAAEPPIAPAAAAAPTAAATDTPPQVRKIDGPAAEPIELSGVAGPAIVKRALPLVTGIVLLLLILRRLRK